MVLLTSEDPMAENSVSQPKKVVPVNSTVEPSDKKLQCVFPANSVTIIRFPVVH
jgi:alpha-L-arabinofuranosidase